MWHRVHYQYYTNVNYRSCPQCLALHGAIRSNPAAFPERQDGCERAILPIARRELKAHREKARRMRATAQAELKRRTLFEEGMDALSADVELAIDRFRAAAAIDLYIEDLERLVMLHSKRLDADPALCERLRALFAKAFSDKFGWHRYELLPEAMRFQREKAGMRRIGELFG